jgi:DNA-binding GntR family transcriptional regulator
MIKVETEGAMTRRGNTVDTLQARLKDAIQAGLFAPGQRLIEADLTKEYGVSRGSLREAFRRLAAEGVVDFVPNKGALVRRISKKELIDLLVLRQSLEGLAARLATKNLGEAQNRAHFEEVLRNIEDIQLKKRGNFSSENTMFHEVIMELADNPQLQMLLKQLQLPLVRFQLRGAIDQEHVEKSQREHAVIAKAILNNNAQQAETLMQQHLQLACDRMLEFPGVFPNEPGNE